MNVKKVLGKFFLVLLMAMMIAGCSTNKNVSTKGNETSKASTEGKTLVIARLSDAENLDHQFMSTINAASVTHEKIYEGLVGRDKNSEIQPLLAEKWKQLDDTKWEFYLRKGVKFHDGSPFNAQAVKATFDRLLDPKVASPRAVVFKMVKEATLISMSPVDSCVFLLLRSITVPCTCSTNSRPSGLASNSVFKASSKESWVMP